MSSSIPEIRPLKAPQGVHLLFAVGLPSVLGSLAVYWVSGLLPWGPETALNLVATLFAALWAAWQVRTHQGLLLKLWLWILIVGAPYLGLAALEGRPWPETFGWEGVHSLWWLVGWGQGLVATLWMTNLAGRARLFQLLDAVPEGQALEDKMRDFQADADFSRDNQRALELSLVLMAASAAVLASWAVPSNLTLNGVLTAGFWGLCTLAGVVLRVYRREMEALMYGRRLTWGDKAGPLGWSAVLAGAAALGAWGLMALGGPWFDWSVLNVSSSGPPGPEAAPVAPAPVPGAGPLVGDHRLQVWIVLLALLVRLPVLGFLVQAVVQGAVAAAPWAVGAFLLWPLVRWVATGGRETRGLWGRWRTLLADQVRAFWAAVGRWWTGEGTLGRSAVPLGPSGAREWLATLFGRPVARVPYPPVVQGFLKVAAWAAPVTAYRSGETTREFLDRLASFLPERASTLAEVRDLLDRELFHPQGLDARGRREFLDRVASLTVSPASHGPSGGVS